jgi:ATP-dependent RNA helicase MSS116
MTKIELKDMPLEPISIPSSPRANFAATQAIQNVSHSTGLTNSGEQAYRAWLGYYNGHLKKVGWDKKQLVQMANAWAGEVGLREQPTLLKKTVGKMGLKGVPGLRVE